ncbi:MotA/TolQ/ExbB proton channel family protein [Hanstruepera flava]|uniref:MotA/TolQ/ExbB proton channel family protein n=1 Tax=Hanstruepera flava TaxID=2930218 RepID=UPI0020280C9D|nr:MotA/TolQ/ExbB proton channel family protein [Hanstruepera flava]
MTFLFPFLFSPFTDGGPVMMSLITICLILSVVFLIKGFTSLKSNAGQSKKMLRLAIDSSLLGLVIGFFASILGLITAFDTVEAMGDPDPSIFAAGLKVSLITATYGLLTFIIARVGILILKGLQKD